MPWLKGMWNVRQRLDRAIGQDEAALMAGCRLLPEFLPVPKKPRPQPGLR